MRPRSIIGPILLIVIGGAFLIHNLRPELPLLDLLGRYWPFLLVVWGLLRLIEVVSWAVTSRPLPRAGLAGWEWGLAVLIIMFGYVGNIARDRWPHAHIGERGIEVFGDPRDYKVNATHPIGEARIVVVDNPTGNVRIVGADTNEVKVGGMTTVRTFKKEDADRAQRESPLEIVSKGDRILILNKQRRQHGPWRMTSDLEVTVPKQVSIEGRGWRGDFDILNIAGDVEIESDNAGVRLADIGGSARVKLNRSDIVRAVNVGGGVKVEGRACEDLELENIRGPVEISGTYSGDLLLQKLANSLQFNSSRTEFRVARVPGEVRIDLGDLSAVNVTGPIFLRTRSRDVELADFTEGLDVELERGSLEVRPGKAPLGKIKLVARSADVQLALPEAAAFGLRAEVERGDLVNEYGDQLTSESRDKWTVLSGPAGREPNITLHAERGTVTISKAAAVLAEVPHAPIAPIPPAPPKVENY